MANQAWQIGRDRRICNMNGKFIKKQTHKRFRQRDRDRLSKLDCDGEFSAFEPEGWKVYEGYWA